jgi:hypothetical protein
MFENVAHHLQQQAINLRANAAQADRFGRSAFNRYYYSTFIRVRKMFLILNPAGNFRIHSQFPEKLRARPEMSSTI